MRHPLDKLDRDLTLDRRGASIAMGEEVSWFHTFQGSETRINAGRKDNTVFIRVDGYAAALNPGQQIVLSTLCTRIPEKGCEQPSWEPEGEQEGSHFFKKFIPFFPRVLKSFHG